MTLVKSFPIWLHSYNIWHTDKMCLLSHFSILFLDFNKKILFLAYDTGAEACATLRNSGYPLLPA